MEELAEKVSSPKNTHEAKLLSCWERFKLKLPWRKRKLGINNITSRKRAAGGGFRYDPLSYAQNFDEGNWDDDNEGTTYRGFSSRFAAPSTKSSLGVDN